MRELDGKVALVTGSGRGLGRACAKLLAREGAKVVVVDINSADGNETVRLIKDTGGQAIFVEANVGNLADIQRMVRTAVETFGGLDCAVNNVVCGLERTPLADITEEDWDRAADVNIRGFFLCMKYEIRAMLERGGGAIVNIGAGNEHSCNPGVSWYIAAKQAIYGMTRCAAIEYAKKGIKINAVGPGSMWTPAMRETAEKIPQHIERLSALSPLGRIAEPEEVAEAVVWLCSPKSSFVLGHTLLADGGSILGTLR